MYRQNLKWRLAAVFIALLIGGIVVVSQSVKDSKAMSKGMPDFNTMTAADFEDGMFVQGTIYELDDEFAYMEEYNTTFGIKTGKERVTAHYYVMPLAQSYYSENVQYIGVCLSNVNQIAVAEQMMQETWDWWDYDIEPDEWTELPLASAKVTKMDSELQDYFYDWIMYGEESTDRADFVQYVAPYIITFYNSEGMSNGLTVGIVILLIGVVGLAVMIVIWIKARQGYSAPTAMPSYPVSSAGGFSGDYNPVSGTDPTGSTGSPMMSSSGTYGGTAGSSAPPPASGSYGEMDELDTSGLGVGIDDGDNTPLE